MTGWEATAQAGSGRSDSGSWMNIAADQAVNDLGVTRLRLEVKPEESEPTQRQQRSRT